MGTWSWACRGGHGEVGRSMLSSGDNYIYRSAGAYRQVQHTWLGGSHKYLAFLRIFLCPATLPELIDEAIIIIQKKIEHAPLEASHYMPSSFNEKNAPAASAHSRVWELRAFRPRVYIPETIHPP